MFMPTKFNISFLWKTLHKHYPRKNKNYQQSLYKSLFAILSLSPLYVSIYLFFLTPVDYSFLLAYPFFIRQVSKPLTE